MDIISFKCIGLETEVSSLEGIIVAVTYKQGGSELKQYLGWEQLEKLRDQINEALGVRNEARHLRNCEQPKPEPVANPNADVKQSYPNGRYTEPKCAVAGCTNPAAPGDILCKYHEVPF